MKKLIISPSILSADFANLGNDVNNVLLAGADWVHVDVMDNHYVPNLTFGPLVCKALRQYGIKAPLDVHLMVKPVDALIDMFAKAGADYITFHPDATDNIDHSIQLIREHGCKVGISLNPDTPVDTLKALIDKVDLVLVMSVYPGFGGQKFIPTSIKKIRMIKELIDRSSNEIRLSVDGGINLDSITEVVRAGADVVVAGSAIFGSENYQKTIEAMREKTSI